MTWPLDADAVAELELEDDEQGTRIWRVGMEKWPNGDRWNELRAAHFVREDAPARERQDADEAFATDVVACSVVWEQDGDGPAVGVAPGEVAEWPDQVDSDVWQVLVYEAFRLNGPKGWEWATERLRRAPLLAVEMAVCREYQIPHSVFVAWPEEDQHLAIADLLEQRGVCPGCSVPRRAMHDIDAAVLEVDTCIWCGIRAQAMGEATAAEHPRIQMKPGY